MSYFLLRPTVDIEKKLNILAKYIERPIYESASTDHPQVTPHWCSKYYKLTSNWYWLHNCTLYQHKEGWHFFIKNFMWKSTFMKIWIWSFPLPFFLPLNFPLTCLETALCELSASLARTFCGVPSFWRLMRSAEQLSAHLGILKAKTWLKHKISIIVDSFLYCTYAVLWLSDKLNFRFSLAVSQ